MSALAHVPPLSPQTGVMSQLCAALLQLCQRGMSVARPSHAAPPVCPAPAARHLRSFKFALPEGEAAVMRSVLSPEVHDSDELGWEEAAEVRAGCSMHLQARAALLGRAAVAAPPGCSSHGGCEVLKSMSSTLVCWVWLCVQAGLTQLGGAHC